MVHDTADADRYIAMSKRSDPNALALAMGERVDGDLRGGLGTYDGPLKVLLAVENPAQIDAALRVPGAPTTLATAKVQALATGKSSFAAMPTAELVLVENSRHFIMDDQPAVWLAALRDALRQC